MNEELTSVRGKPIGVSEALQQAARAHAQGNLDQAELLCQTVLKADADNFDAKHLLGVLRFQQGRYAAAVDLFEAALKVRPDAAWVMMNIGIALKELGLNEQALASYDRALSLAPDYAEALYSRANALFDLRRVDEALAGYERALAIKPDYAEALNNRGNALRDLRRVSEALASYERALAIKPDYPDALNNRGIVLRDLRRFEEALASFDAAIALKPAHAEALNNRGNALRDLRQNEKALESFDRALAINPNHAKALYSRGNALFELKRIEEALASYERALAVKPDYAEALNNRGNALVKLKRSDQALSSYDRALAIKPAYADALNNRGNVLKDFGRIEDALASYEQALAVNPNHADTLSNRGNALFELNRVDEAIASYSRAIAIRPNYAEALSNRAMASLLLGDFASGWRDYEHRYERDDAPNRVLKAPFPFWKGEDLAGKSIIVYEEQGIGDIVNFSRYLDRLTALGARVVFLVRPALHRLLRASFPDVKIVDRPPAKQAFDFQSALMSLPGAFKTALDTVPAEIPYLTAESVLVAKWRQRLGEQGLKIGVTWQGNPARKFDTARSIPLRAFQPLAAVPGVRLISLQKNDGVAQIAELNGAFAVESFADEMDSGPDAFIDTAAIMANLDLVVTSDTSIAHVAGALGRPVWVALKHVPDWRWMLGRSDSPWYPTMTLYRQTARDDWQGVFGRMALDLAKFAGSRKAASPIRLQIPGSIGELFDKITILEIKAARIADPAKLRHVTHELELLREVEARLGASGAEEESLIAELRHVNETLWDVEDSIRACEARQEFGAEFIALARSVYRHNDRRAELKKRLNALHGSELVEEKSYAASA